MTAFEKLIAFVLWPFLVAGCIGLLLVSCFVLWVLIPFAKGRG